MRKRTAPTRVAVLAAAMTVGGFLPVIPAAAHPFGPPPTALVSSSGHRVVVEWGAAPDDALVVGMAIGVLDDTSLEQYLEGPVQVAPSAAKEDELSASPALRAYLLDRIAVAQEGRACDGTVEVIGSFLTDGAIVTYECPQPVEVVDLRITMLHDVHDAYRTFAITEGRGAPPQSVFTVESPEQRWDFAAETADRPAATRTLPLALGVGAGAALIGMVLWRHRSRRGGAV